MAPLATFFALIAGTLATVKAQNVSTYNFLSRPDIVAPQFRIASIDNSSAYDGYTFVTPNSPTGSNFTVAMYMYNNQGSLVWSGHKFNNPGHSVNGFYSCFYQGSPHICVTFFQGPVGGGAARSSYSLIIDKTYSLVHAVAPSAVYNGSVLTQDLHEFNVVGSTGASAMLSSYATVHQPTNIPGCPGSPTAQYIKTGLFTETSTDGLNTTIFQWNALDHINVTDTYVCPGDLMVGSGNTSTDGFDFFHINAIDRNGDGDYVVSSRHTSAIFKIAGAQSPSGQPPGSVLWRLGGRQNSFTMNTQVENSGQFNFSFQHHARFRDGGVHLWDNANDAIVAASGASSSGMGVDIDENSMTATLVYQAVPPSKALDSSQGDHQVLPNGNHFCGMGSTPEVFERTPSGDLAMDAYFGELPMQSYRAFKYAWTGQPQASEMALFTYAHTCSSKVAYYVSFNGATNVAQYRLFASNSSSGTFSQIGTIAKDSNFESTFVADQFALFGYAQALDANGTLLGSTNHISTFVPGASLAAQCSDTACPPGTNYLTAPKGNCTVSQFR